MGDDEDISALVGTDDFDEFGKSAGGDSESAFAVERGEGKRIFFPGGGFFGEFGFDFFAGELFPVAVGDFAETFAFLDGELVGGGEDGSGFDRAVEG